MNNNFPYLIDLKTSNNEGVIHFPPAPKTFYASYIKKVYNIGELKNKNLKLSTALTISSGIIRGGRVGRKCVTVSVCKVWLPETLCPNRD